MDFSFVQYLEETVIWVDHIKVLILERVFNSYLSEILILYICLRHDDDHIYKQSFVNI